MKTQMIKQTKKAVKMKKKTEERKNKFFGYSP